MDDCNQVGDRMQTISNKIVGASFVFACLATGLTFLLTLYELFARYLFNAPTLWTSDFSNYLFCFSIFLALPYVVLQGSSISISIILDAAGPTAKRRMSIFLEAASSIACLVVAILCLTVTIRDYSRGTLTLAAIPMPRWLLTASLTYGFALCALAHLERALGSVTTHDDTAVL
jgi:C4-dicarboxylate transporter DctQ subunit